MPANTAPSALEVLVDPSRASFVPVCALVGDESFLQHEVRRALVVQFTGDPYAMADVVDGRTAELRDLLDALHERSLFGGDRRVVVLERAEAFIKAYREQLEDYVARPVADVALLLEVDSLPGNTRLAKRIAEAGLVLKCSPPDGGRELTEFNRQLKEWLVAVAKRDFGAELARPAAETLLELLPSEPGVLYQEVSRLALLAGDARKIEPALVRDNVGGWRTRKTWDMIDAAADGRAGDALAQLDRLLAAGEEAFGLLPQMASTLRKFAAAARMFETAERRKQSLSLTEALKRAGMPPFKLGDAERQLRQIGRPRATQLYRWLLAADLELKGHNSTKERARRVLETLIVRLSREAQAVR